MIFRTLPLGNRKKWESLKPATGNAFNTNRGEAS